MTEAQDRHTVFVSYSWDSEEHKQWVLRVAEVLHREPDIDVTFDQFDVWAGKDLTHFMERGLECERVVVVSTPTYVRKSRERVGGVGYECSLITADLVKDMKQDTFIPVLRAGEDVPAFLGTKLRLDFRDDRRFEESIERLIAAIRREPEARRPEKRVGGGLLTKDASSPPDVSNGERGRTLRPQIVLEGHFAHREMQGRKQGMYLHNVGDGVALEVQVEPLGHEPKWMMFGQVAVMRPNTNSIEVPITFVEAPDVFEVGAYISLVSTLRGEANGTDDVAVHDAHPLRITYRDREGTEYVSDEYELHFHESKPFIAANAYYEVQRKRSAQALVEKPLANLQSAVAIGPRSMLTEQQLQDLSQAVAELQQGQEARTLTVEQREALVESLRSLPRHDIAVFGAPSDAESMEFARKIGGAFQSAGWRAEIRTAVHADTVEGIHVVYLTGEQSQPPSSEPGCVNVLMWAFRNAGLNATATPLVETPTPMDVYVVVGHKPRE